MPKKKFEETPYNPIAADLMREVAANGHHLSPVPSIGSTAPATTPPSTSVLAFRATNPTRSTAPQPAQPTITKRFLLTRGENEELNAFILRLEQHAKTKLTLSVLVRAALSLTMQAEELLLTELAGGFPRPFPSTHDLIAQGEFEDRWMRCLANGLRKMSRLSIREPNA